MTGAPPLVVSSYTLGTEVEFGERVRAAAAAGYDGIGLRAENYWAAGLGDAAMLAIAEQHGVRILEVEYLTGWGTAADRDAAQQAKERTVFHMARAFGVRHLNAGLLEKLPLDVVGEEFAALCERAGPDLTVALEFMPYSGVPDLATAWRIVQGYPTPALSSTAGTGRAPASRSPTSMTCLRSGSFRYSCLTCGRSRWSLSARNRSDTGCRRGRDTATRSEWCGP